MHAHYCQDSAGTPTADFEATLRTLILDSSAEEVSIEGTCDLTASSAVVPSWRVTIEKIDGAVPPDDETTFLDE